MDPHDDASMDHPFDAADGEASASQAIDEAFQIEPDVGAALLLSGNFSRSLADRVFSSLTQDEIARLGHGLLRLKAMSEDRVERIWNRITALFTGDWREEDDLVEFIRSVLRKGVREEPPLSSVQKLALLLLSIGDDSSHGVSAAIMNGLNRQGIAELTREMAHLLHYPSNGISERVIGEFLAFCAARALPNTAFMSLRVMEMEAERLVRRNPSSCGEVASRLWLNEGELLSTFQEAARLQPEKTVEMLRDFAYGPAHYYYIPPMERAATFRACLSPEAAALIDEALQSETLPEPLMSIARRESVLREFLHRYYLEYMKLIPVVMQ